MLHILFVSIFCVGISSTLPANPFLKDLRYQYAPDSNGDYHLVDTWTSVSDFLRASRYNPASSNVYHLFTRTNPTISNPLMINNVNLLTQSNFDSSRRTVVLIHGWMNSVVSPFNNVLVPVLLAAEDLNVIVLDWSVGANVIDYRELNMNCVLSGIAAADFIDWLNHQSGSTLSQYHIIGHGVGGHQAGVVGRFLEGRVPYITGLNPSLLGWATNPFRFQPNDAIYTEVIHTNYLYGYPGDLGHVGFYPSQGISMPGCASNTCDHERSFFYLAESITSGGFTGIQCINYYAALLGLCSGPRQLQMGGLSPKTGERGAYLLEVNAAPPFSQA